VRALEGAPAMERFVPGSAEVPASLRFEIARMARDFQKKRPTPATQDAMTQSQV